MRLADFYKLAIKCGSERDVRGRRKAVFQDSSILWGDPDKNIRKVMAGIDIEVAELLLADRVRQSEGLDMVLSHHPEGRAYAQLAKVMQLQVELLQSSGIKRAVAQKFLDERMQEVERRILSQNHTRPVDAARLLDIPFMCLHTPADNHVFWFLRELIRKKKPASVQDLMDLLNEIPEYRDAAKLGVGPRIILGSPKRKAGKVLLEMTGGTEGPKDIFEKLYAGGIRTLVSMHLSDEHFKKAKDANLNVVIAGHISSDTLGLNLLLDRVERAAKERLEFVGCSGFERFRRN